VWQLLGEGCEKNSTKVQKMLTSQIFAVMFLVTSTSGCYSYQVSSIPVQRVTCYDNFCLFQFFSILAVSMATAAIFKKSTLKSTTLHGI
jgi:hypothetical protein